MPKQLRLYTINKGCLRQFAQEWQDKVLPLRQEQGWKIERAWLVEDTNQFAWILSCDEKESWLSKDENYYASTDRQMLNPNPARLIARVEEYFVEDIDL